MESAISEQLFCNEQVNPNNEPCYGISTVSGLQRAAQQGQKIYQINQNNRAQLSNIAISDDNMANDINTAINSGGYVIVPEKAVKGTGRDAIYVYMTYNGQTGYQSWKISGGLNGSDADCSPDDSSGNICNDMTSYALFAISVITAGVAETGSVLAIGASALASVLGGAIAICMLGQVVIEALCQAKCQPEKDCILQFAASALISIVAFSAIGALFGPVGALLGFIFSTLVVGAFQAAIQTGCVTISAVGACRDEI